MQGGMDAAIIARFAGLTLAAATGALDHWAATPRGRLALLIALDQFPRSLWRDTPAAYAQDIKAARLALEGLRNGHFDSLEPWEQNFYVIAIAHCEGPDHLERMDRLESIVEGIVSRMPEALAPLAERFRSQRARVREIIKPGESLPDDTEVAELITMLVRFRTQAVAAVTATLAGSIESTIESLVSRMLADYIDPES